MCVCVCFCKKLILLLWSSGSVEIGGKNLTQDGGWRGSTSTYGKKKKKKKRTWCFLMRLHLLGGAVRGISMARADAGRTSSFRLHSQAKCAKNSEKGDA